MSLQVSSGPVAETPARDKSALTRNHTQPGPAPKPRHCIQPGQSQAQSHPGARPAPAATSESPAPAPDAVSLLVQLSRLCLSHPDPEEGGLAFRAQARRAALVKPLRGQLYRNSDSATAAPARPWTGSSPIVPKSQLAHTASFAAAPAAAAAWHPVRPAAAHSRPADDGNRNAPSYPSHLHGGKPGNTARRCTGSAAGRSPRSCARVLKIRTRHDEIPPAAGIAYMT
jgi:hypothetical protein